MAWEFSFLFSLQSIHNPVLDWIMVFFTSLGDTGFLWLLCVLVLLCVKKHRRWGITLLVAVAVSFFLGEVLLKEIFMRPRPCTVYPEVPLLIPTPQSWSFPSGHSSASMTAAVVLLRMNRKLGLATLVIALLIAFSRMYLFVHFPTDVLAGLLLGLSCALPVLKWLAPEGNRLGDS